MFNADRQRRRWRRWIARLLAGFWRVLWTGAGLAEGIKEGMSVGGTVLHSFAPGGVFLATAIVAWLSDEAGCVLLLDEGISLCVLYPMSVRTVSTNLSIPVLLVLCAPPIVAGLLFLIEWARNRHSSVLPLHQKLYRKKGFRHEDHA
jgi:hypothetical protein